MANGKLSKMDINKFPLHSSDELYYEIIVTSNKGDYSDSKLQVAPTTGKLAHIIRESFFRYGIYHPVAVGRWESTQPVINDKGDKLFYQLHLKRNDAFDLTQEEQNFITALFNDGNYNREDEAEWKAKEGRIQRWAKDKYGIGGFIFGTLLGGFIGFGLGKAVGFGRAVRGYALGGEINTDNEHDFADSIKEALEAGQNFIDEYEYTSYRQGEGLAVNVKLYDAYEDVEDLIDEMDISAEQKEWLKREADDEWSYNQFNWWLEWERENVPELLSEQFDELDKNEILFGGRSGGWLIFASTGNLQSEMDELSYLYDDYFDSEGTFIDDEYDSYEEFKESDEYEEAIDLIKRIYTVVNQYYEVVDYINEAKRGMPDAWKEELKFRLEEKVEDFADRTTEQEIPDDDLDAIWNDGKAPAYPIILKRMVADTTVDTYEEGETDEFGTSWDMKFNKTFSGDNAGKEILSFINDNIIYAYPDYEAKDFIVGESTIQTDMLVNAENSQAEKSEIEEWKKGKKKLWNAHYWIHLVYDVPVESKFDGGGLIGDYYSSTEFVDNNNLRSEAKKLFGEEWESGGDYSDDTTEIEMLLEGKGDYNVEYIETENDKDGEGRIYVTQKKSKGGSTYEGGGDLKPIPEGNKGLPKLPKEVRNKMGYMEGGGEITDDQYNEVVRNWVYFTYNYPHGFVEKAFTSNPTHFQEKWLGAYDRVGSRGAVNEFYSWLSDGYRKKLTDWVRDNYFYSNSKRSMLLRISPEKYFNIIQHWFFFSMNYPHGFVEKVFANNQPQHFEGKWTASYSRAKAIGAVNDFYTELSEGNQDRLSEWAKKNYAGYKFDGGGEIRFGERLESGGFDMYVDEGRFEIELDENMKPKGILSGGFPQMYRHLPHRSSVFRKYKDAILEHIKELADDFEVHGHYTVSNFGGYEIMLSDDGDSARVRDSFGSGDPKTSDWLPIEYVDDEETGEPEPVIDPDGYDIPLNMVMRANYYYGGEAYEGDDIPDWAEEALKDLRSENDDDSMVISDVDWKRVEISGGSGHYIVFKNESDAEDYAVKRVEEDLEENLQYFNQDFIMGHIDSVRASRFFHEIYDEWNRSYVDDIESESGGQYPNRLIEELVQNGLMSEEDAMDDDAESIAEDKKDEYVNLLTKDQIDEGSYGYDYYKFNFGEDEASKVIIDNGLIDTDSASQDAVDADGIAHFIAGYDGETVYLSDDVVAYRTN